MLCHFERFSITVFDILQGALQLGVVASAVEEVHIKVYLDVGLNTYTLKTFIIQ